MSADLLLFCISIVCIRVLDQTPPLHPFAGASGRDYLSIIPAETTQKKPINSRFFLTCSPSGKHASFFSNIRWLDPRKNVIESKSGRLEPSLYTEKKKIGDTESISLIFTSLQKQEAGNYSCTADYDDGEKFTKTVTIEWIIAITWEDAPENQFPIYGENYLVKCKVQARPAPQIDWFHDGKPIVSSDNHRVIEVNGLKINNVQESDDGHYVCRASVSETGELQERNIRVEVHRKPVMLQNDTQVDVIEGEPASINCTASGKPPPKYSWSISVGDDLKQSDRFKVNEITGQLFIKKVISKDTGIFSCTAMNAAGDAMMNIMVNVIIKPKISEFNNMTIPVTNTVNITCIAKGNPGPEITFRKHTSDKPYTLGVQSTDDRITLTNERFENNQLTVGTLTITNVMRSDDGLYECKAQNSAGSALKNGHLIVEFPPSFESMQNLTEVWTWSNRPVNITCVAESIPNATIRWETGAHRIKNDDTNGPFKVFDLGPISTIQVKPQDNRYYTSYRCIATNPHGIKEHVIKLSEGHKPSQITKATIKEITATTAIFDLTLPIVEYGVPIKSVTVQYKQPDQTWNQAKNRTWSVQSKDNYFVVEDLQPQTRYDFQFAARNDVGFGAWGSHIEEFTKAKTVPSEPKILRTKEEHEISRFSDKYELRWIVSADNGEPIDLYEIKYCEVERVDGKWELLENTCAYRDAKSVVNTATWLNNLRSSTYYKVEIRAHNLLGYSKPGQMYFQTARESTGSPADSIISAGETTNLAVTAIATTLILSLTV